MSPKRDHLRLTPDPDRSYSVILVHPQSPQNIGLVARAMQNTGFKRLHLVLEGPLPQESRLTAVHAEDILGGAELFPDVAAAVSDLDVVAAAVARHRKNFSAMSLKEALDRVARYPAGTRIGFLFGNERTGLRSSELQHTNFRFSIPQARTQPSYNLASAVLLTLFFLAQRGPVPGPPEGAAKPLPRREQEKCIHRILEKLEGGGFMHPGNRRHMGQSVSELFGRLDMSPRDRDLLLAIFGKAFTPSAGEAKDNKIRS